ncbi:MAG: hypothetical protein HOB84_14985 [Candidatus Marinimicrobia bacterium]|jgi:hypothetical protein|nr:hypothetical protein [Candidatus Neomarinimicrobiota bacterium]MBT4360693.1 hypothetical protein [Candidatus Neomarinimicrobiota bacterium]MBT4716072.1 hypothetical protein [Candidatus Neomarinimicrobiota bacterium]MBT4946078.1 hypothetical protein [Candidatus Neomarinimicrobiota bacterium]MBT5269524.1 hypothetical protein [Candidatus Neomarinimicrobiota bacterium]
MLFPTDTKSGNLIPGQIQKGEMLFPAGKKRKSNFMSMMNGQKRKGQNKAPPYFDRKLEIFNSHGRKKSPGE